MASPREGQIPRTEELVRFLSEPASYPRRTSKVQCVQTHMAYVFLTDSFAYKLKKPVRYSFLDFSSVELRRAACEAEVRLNRRLAPTIYLGMLPVTRDLSGSLRLGETPGGVAVDWVVWMRRLPADRMLDAVIRAGGPTRRELRGMVKKLVAFYRGAPVEPIEPAAYVEQLGRSVESDVSSLLAHADHLPLPAIEPVGAALRKQLEDGGGLFARRARDGRIVEAHGDLRPEHICLVMPPAIIDCLEFRRDFRILDPAEELAFLAMECERAGAAWIRRALFEAYAELSGDDPPKPVVEFHIGARALLRAKIAIWHLRNGDPTATDRWRSASLEYLQLAARYAGVDDAAAPTR
jgi:uncharacterized protein